MDFVVPFLGKMLLIATDAHSKWPEAIIMTTTTAAKTVNVLHDIFAKNGLPRQLVSDNGPQFCADEFTRFMKENRIKTAPYHPANNGATERFVQTIKQSLRLSHKCGLPLEQSLAIFLLRYRTTPHATTGEAPCSLCCNRMLCTRLDLITADLGAHAREKQAQQKGYHNRGSHPRQLTAGQVVWAQNLRKGPHWRKAVVSDGLGPVTYLVQLDGGQLWGRHIDHLRVGSEAPVEEGADQDGAECFPGNVSKNDPLAGTPMKPPCRSQADTETSINPPTPVN